MDERRQTNFMLYRITKPWLCCSLLVIGVIVTIARIASAEAKPASIPLKVTAIETNKKVDKVIESNQDPKIALYHTIKIRIEGLAAWVKEANRDPSKVAAMCLCTTLQYRCLGPRP